MREIDEDRIYKQSIMIGGVVTITILSLFAVLLFSCCASPWRACPPSQIDSIYIEKRDTIIMRDTTVMVKVKDSLVYQKVKDTVSHLATDVAISDAWLSNGYLHHQLQNKQCLLPIEVTLPKAISREVQHHFRVVTETVEVEKQLPWWKEGLMALGKLVILAAFIVMTIHVLRKYLFKG